MSSRSRIHSFHPDSYGDIKTAVRALMHAAGGEAKAADLCRVSKSTLSEYGNPAHADRHMPVDVVLALETATGEMPVSGHLAASQDCVLLRLPDIGAKTEWLAHLTGIGKEAGEVFSQAGAFLADDGDIDATEAPALLREVDELLMAVAGMRAAVRGRLPRD